MLLITILSLIGCMAYHREVDTNGSTTIFSSSGYHGTSVLTHDEIAAQVLANAANGVPVTVQLDADGNARYTVGYAGYRSAANEDWYMRGQEMVARRAALNAGGSTSGTGTISASNVRVDPNVRCPAKGDPTSVAEDLACKQADLDANTIAIENNPAVRR